MFVTLLGRPGAGKTSLGRALAQATDAPYVGGGALLRRRVRERGPGWKRLLWHLENRVDTPAEFQLELLRDALAAQSRGAILDGFPKTADLHQRVEAVLGEPIGLAVYLDAPAELAQYRVAHRLVCDICALPDSDLVAAVGSACSAKDCDGHLERRPGDAEAGHAREAADSVALRGLFEASDRLLTLDASTSVGERTEAVIHELRRREEFSGK